MAIQRGNPALASYIPANDMHFFAIAVRGKRNHIYHGDTESHGEELERKIKCKPRKHTEEPAADTKKTEINYKW